MKSNFRKDIYCGSLYKMPFKEINASIPSTFKRRGLKRDSGS